MIKDSIRLPTPPMAGNEHDFQTQGSSGPSAYSEGSDSGSSVLPWHELPKPGGVDQWCDGAKIRIATDHAIKVNMKVNVLEVREIDQVRETFTIVFTVHFYHVDPLLKDFRTDVTYTSAEGVHVEKQCLIIEAWKYSSRGVVRVLCESGLEREFKPTDIKSIRQPNWDSADPIFVPAFSFGNAVGKPQTLQHERMLEYCSAAGGHVFEKYKFQGTFAERYELKGMPFDRQLLRVRIYCEHPVWRMQLAPFKDDRAGWLNSRMGVPSEWLVDDDVTVRGVKVPACRLMVWKLCDNSFRSSAEVLVHVNRVAAFYISNVVLVNFFITFMTVCAFACSPDDFQGRAKIQFTILLTTVGYKVVTTEWTPVKSYLTFLDKCMLVNFFFQCAAIMQSFCSIFLGCSVVADLDGNWMDGVFNGEYTDRPPPPRECWDRLYIFEIWYAWVFYGGWTLAHCALLICHHYGLTYNFFGTWDIVYTENNMVGEVLTSYDQHPYGGDIEPTALRRLPSVSRPLI